MSVEYIRLHLIDSDDSQRGIVDLPGNKAGRRRSPEAARQAWSNRAGLACPFGVFGHCPTCSMSDRLGVSDHWHMMSRPGTVRVSVSESLTESDGATGRSAAALPPHWPQSHWY